MNPSLMRYSLLFLLLVIVCCANAQKKLFTVISVHGVVTLDADTLTCGKTVTDLYQKFKVVGKSSYATILTERGYAFQIDAGSYSVEEIYKTNFQAHERIGTIYVDDFSEIRVAVFKSYKPYPLFGDSITIIARPYQKQLKQYRVIISDLMDKKLYDSLSSSHIQIVNISDLLYQSKALIYRVESDLKKVNSKHYLIKKMEQQQRLTLERDLKCIAETDFVDRELATMALFDIHNLYFDQFHHLYKLWKYSATTGNLITHPYYEELIKRYELDKFLPIPLTGY